MTEKGSWPELTDILRSRSTTIRLGGPLDAARAMNRLIRQGAGRKVDEPTRPRDSQGRFTPDGQAT